MSFRTWIWTILTGSRFKSYNMEGERYIKSKQYVDSLQVFRKIVRGWPTKPEGYEGMSRAYLGMGLRPEAAREHVIAKSIRVVDKSPNNLEARVELASALLEKDMFGWAATHIDRALKISPNDRDILLLSARVFRGNRNYNRAVKSLRVALGNAPLDGDLYEQLAYCLRAAHRTSEAVKAANLAKALKASAANPGNPLLLEQAARLFISNNQKRLAMDLINNALVKQPQNAALLRLLGDIHFQDGKIEKAIDCLTRSVTADPTDQRAHKILSQALAKEGKTQEAAKHLALSEQMSQAKKTGDPLAAQMAEVRMLVDGGRQEDAMVKAAAMTKAFPEDWRGFFLLGLVLKTQQKPKEAMGAMLRASRLNSRSPEVLMEMAKIKADQGLSIESISDARKAVNLSPREPCFRRDLSKILRTFGYMDQAIEEEEIVESLT